MASTSASAAPARRHDGLSSAAKLVLSIFLIPAPFELLTAFAKKEEYDFGRLAIIGGTLAALAVVVVLSQRRIRVQSAIGVYLVAAGAAITALGVVLTFRPDLLLRSFTWTPAVETAVSALAPAAGLLLMAAGVFLVRDQAHRTREDADAPSPRSIANPKLVRLGDRNGSVWRSEHFSDHPAADGILEICTGYLSTSDLHFVAYFTAEDQCLFYVDLLDDESLRRYNVRDTANRRRLYERAGRRMRSTARKLDGQWRGLDSGSIVRLVFDVEEGALFYYRLRDLGYLLGVTLDQTEVDPADRKMSAAANEILPHLGRRPAADFHRK